MRSLTDEDIQALATELIRQDIWKKDGERDAVFSLAAAGGQCAIGERAWVEALSGSSASAAKLAVIGDDSYSPYGALMASRTSGGGGIGAFWLVHQDKRAGAGSPGGAWGAYGEAFMHADAHPDATLINTELAIINNRATCADINPYNMSWYGLVDGLRIGVGKPGCNGQEVSSLLSLANIEGTQTAKARKGIVFAYDVIKIIGGFGNALSFGYQQGMQWYVPGGGLGPRIKSDTTSPPHAPSIVFGNGAVHFTDAAGVAQFSLNTESGMMYSGADAITPAPPNAEYDYKFHTVAGGIPIWFKAYRK